MPWTPYTHDELMLPAARRAITHVSLHNGIPRTGTELQGPIYKREPIDLSLPTDEKFEGSKVLVAVPPGAEVTAVGFWDRAVGGNMIAWAPLSKVLKFKGRGAVSIDRSIFDLIALGG